MTHRLRIASRILQGLGLEPTVEHCQQCVWHPNADPYLRTRPGMHFCWDACKTTWPEWATDDLFNHAFALANEYQTQHGAFERRKAELVKA